eukprot:1593065-Pyramimonas_sp.AAC.1
MTDVSIHSLRSSRARPRLRSSMSEGARGPCEGSVNPRGEDGQRSQGYPLASSSLRPILSGFRGPTSFDKGSPGPPRPWHPYRAAL